MGKLSGTVGETTIASTQMPSHTHTKGSGVWSGSPYTNPGLTAPSNSGARMTTDATGGSQSHTHSMTDISSGVANSLPPYFSMTYIIRIM